MSWELIDTDAALARIIAENADCRAVAVDTEFMRRNTFYPKVALVQLCFGSTAWLVDPLAIADPAPLRALLSNERMVKVLHSASEDLEVFQQWLGVLPAPLFDTQRAAALLDIGFGMGYSALVKVLCDVDLPKGETRSDWLQRPLTHSQCDYAAQDVTHLINLWSILDQRCWEQNKFDWVLADGIAAAGGLASASGEYYKRVKTAWKLDARQLAGLVAVSDWRERVARERDKPRNWIVDDSACLALATDLPDTTGELAQSGLPPGVVRRDGEELLALLAAVRALPEADLPARLPAPLGPGQRIELKRLKQRARSIAAELAVAPEAVLPGKDFELLLREAAGESVVVPAHWRGWREELVIAPLRAQLAGASG